MEYNFSMILLGIMLAPAIIVAMYITISILLKSILVFWLDAFSIIGWENPKKYCEYHSII